MSGRYTIEPGTFASLAFEVVLPHDAHEHCERSRMAAIERERAGGYGAVAFNETRESFEVRRVGDSPVAVAFSSAAEAMRYGHDIAGDWAPSSVEVWRVSPLGARNLVVTYRSRPAVVEHWHAELAGLDR